MSYLDGWNEAEKRFDALICKKGKPCGDRCIPKEFDCKSQGKGALKSTAQAIALGAGALGGAALLNQGSRQINRQVERKIQKPIDEAVDQAVDKTIEKGKEFAKSVKSKFTKKKEN